MATTVHFGRVQDLERGTWTPVVTPTSGAITTYTVNKAKYIKADRLVVATVRITVSNNGTGAGAIKVSLPYTCDDTFHFGNGANGITGKALSVYAYPDSTDGFVKAYDAAYPIVSGDIILATFVYQSAS